MKTQQDILHGRSLEAHDMTSESLIAVVDEDLAREMYGRSNVVGKPLAQLLLARDATVTICHSRTPDLPYFLRQADLVVAAAGKPRFITAPMIKPGAVVVDVGINDLNGQIVGDVDFAGASAVASAITPVPGGIGTVSTVMVLEAVLRKWQD